MTMEQAKRQVEQRSGIPNVAYELKGIAAMEVCKADAEQAGDREVLEVLDQLERRERENVERLNGVLIAWSLYPIG